MHFDDHQAAARATTRRLLLLFVLNVLLTVLGVNALLALAWWAMSLGLFGGGFPYLFFQTNTVMVLLFVLGGWWLESWQLRSGGAAYVAQWLGGRELTEQVYRFNEQRLRNIVHEMAIASAMPPPKVFVLDQEHLINAFAAGWDANDTAIIVTKGALERLTRDELQGVVAHEFGHLQAGDTRLNMRLIGMVFGLQMVYTMGEDLWTVDARGQRGPWALVGLALMGAGWMGWLSGRLLKAAVSRQREFLADAHAAQYTRYPHGLAGALRKLMTQEREGLHMQHPHTEYVSHVLFWSNRGRAWLATHPPVEERIRRLTGRILSPLSAEVLPDTADDGRSVLVPLAAVVASTAAACASSPVAAGGQAAPSLSPAVPVSVRVNVDAWLTPGQVRATVLAFFVPSDKTGDTEELQQWQSYTEGVEKATSVLDTVWALSPKQKPIDFERTLERAAQLPAPYKTLTLTQMVQLVRADQRWSLHEYVQLRLAQMYLQDTPQPNSSRCSLVDADEAVSVASVALAVAGAADPHAVLNKVLSALHRPMPTSLPLLNPNSLDDAWWKLRGVAALEKPVLVKLWVGVVLAAATPAQQQQATALRWICHLIDSPLPAQLQDFFET